MKKSAAAIILFLLAFPALGKEAYLRDVPEGHWAYDAVYDLIKQGVSGGYPDGTYRGRRLMSRYEMASFLSKLARSFEVKRGIEEKLIEELRSETALLQFEREQKKRETQVEGELLSRAREGWADGIRAGKIDYRLRYVWKRNLADGSGLKIDLDTMDGGFNGAERDLATEMLSLAGKLKLGLGEINASFGPGEVKHIDDGLFPAENNMVYRRPFRAVAWSADLGQSSFGLDYIARSSLSSGYIDYSEVSGRLSQKLANFKFILNPRIFYDNANRRDVRLEFSSRFIPNRWFESAILLGAVKNADYPHGLYIEAELSIADKFRLMAQKVGSQYRRTFDYNILDLFDRNIEDGAASVGMELKNEFANGWSAGLKGNYNSSGEALTGEMRIGRKVTGTALLSMVCRGYKINNSYSSSLGWELNAQF